MAGNPDLQVPVIGISQQLKNDQEVINQVFEREKLQIVEDFIKRLTFKYPDNGSIKANYAKVLELNGNFEKALEVVVSSLENSFGEIEIYQQITELHHKNGDI